MHYSMSGTQWRKLISGCFKVRTCVSGPTVLKTALVWFGTWTIIIIELKLLCTIFVGSLLQMVLNASLVYLFIGPRIDRPMTISSFTLFMTLPFFTGIANLFYANPSHQDLNSVNRLTLRQFFIWGEITTPHGTREPLKTNCGIKQSTYVVQFVTIIYYCMG